MLYIDSSLTLVLYISYTDLHLRSIRQSLMNGLINSCQTRTSKSTFLYTYSKTVKFCACFSMICGNHFISDQLLFTVTY